MASKRDKRDASLDEQAPFEAVLDRLEGIVGQLEGGELSLEESLSSFEEGVSLARRASARLDDMERRIEVLTEAGTLEPLDAGGEERDADDERGG